MPAPGGPYRLHLECGALLLGCLSGHDRQGMYAGSSSPLGAAGVPVQYRAGWNLVGGPAGTVFGASGSLYSLAAGDTAYSPSAGDAAVSSGRGYWAYFPRDTTVALNGAGVSGMTI